MIKIEVKSDEFEVFSGTSKRTGNPYSIKKQQAYAHLPGKPYPSEISISLADDQEPFKPGNYTLSPESLKINNWGNLEIGRVVLVQSAAARAA